MSDKTGNLTQEVIDNLKVVALAGTSSLSEAQLLLETTYALRTLEDRVPFTSTVVQWQPSSPYAAVIMEKNGVYTLFIGFALEVIQAMQQHEKT